MHQDLRNVCYRNECYDSANVLRKFKFQKIRQFILHFSALLFGKVGEIGSLGVGGFVCCSWGGMRNGSPGLGRAVFGVLGEMFGLGEESEEHTGGNCGADNSGNVRTHGVHEQVVAGVVFEAEVV